nr:MAG TPA: hypothetical protein [Caudoviricetes sp.]
MSVYNLKELEPGELTKYSYIGGGPAILNINIGGASTRNWLFLRNISGYYGNYMLTLRTPWYARKVDVRRW